MNLCSRWEAAWEALDLATENSKQSANFLFGPLLICQKKKDHLVTVHIQFSSSVVPTGGSVKCQQDCELVLNMLLTFLGGGCGSSGLILNSKAQLLPCCLQAISPICIGWLATFSWSLNISVSWETAKAGMTLPICLQSAKLKQKKKNPNLHHS